MRRRIEWIEAGLREEEVCFGTMGVVWTARGNEESIAMAAPRKLVLAGRRKKDALVERANARFRVELSSSSKPRQGAALAAAKFSVEFLQKFPPDSAQRAHVMKVGCPSSAVDPALTY